jgi:5'-3' exonuclease
MSNKAFFKSLLDNIKESKQEPLHLNSKVLLIDSMNTFLRCFTMIQHLNYQGHHIGGLTGFLKSVGFAINHIKPTRVILCFEGAGSTTNRKYLYPEYKANRKLIKVTHWETLNSKEEESESIENQIVRLINPQIITALTQKVFISKGATNANNEFYISRNGYWTQVPAITASSLYLYYQDGGDSNFYSGN